jgi:homoserine dehydrogenase
MSRSIRLALVGLGNVGQSFLDLMDTKAALLADSHGIELVLTGVADSSAAALAPAGLNTRALRAHKSAGKPLHTFPASTQGMSAQEMVTEAEADVLLEASTVNLKTGQPGLNCVRIAIRRGMDIVLANKGPLVLAFAELEAAAEAAGVGLAYSATVCGALPVVNIGRRDLTACDIRAVAGVFNATSNSILAAMARGGNYADALRQAQLDGIAEADPSLDVEGWDTANKLVIVANSILRQPCTLADVQPVIGITDITSAQIQAHAARGEVVKLVARAEPELTGLRNMAGLPYRLSVQPEWLPADAFLASISGWEMGIVFDTDIMGLQQLKVDERGPIPTAAAMLRDVIMLGGKPAGK